MDNSNQQEIDSYWNEVNLEYFDSSGNFYINNDSGNVMLQNAVYIDEDPHLNPPPLDCMPDSTDQFPSTSVALMPSAAFSTNSWKGAYNFDISFDEKEALKSQTFIFEASEDKIYLKPQVLCPFNFSVSCVPPEETIIRAKLVYSQPEYSMTPVKRCLNHSSHQDPSNMNFNYPEHIIRSTNIGVTYEIDVNGHMSLVLPYSSPPLGTNYSIGLYKFMCLSSCTGGIDRKSLKLVFSLENKMNVLGLRTFPIRICACPKRDRINEGKKILKRKPPSESVVKLEGHMPKKPKPDEYLIKVNHLEDYKILKELRDALEFKRKYKKDDP